MRWAVAMVVGTVVIASAALVIARADDRPARSHTPLAVEPTADVAPSPRPTTAVLVEHGSRELPMVALTFDADMTAGMRRLLDTGAASSFNNRRLVDELQRLDVPATFFITGLWFEEYPEEVRRLAADPRFELASHSVSHRGFAGDCYGLGTVARPDMVGEVIGPLTSMREAGLRTVPYFRFPGGCHDQQALAAVASAGVTAIQWDVISGDAGGASADLMAENVLAGARNGSIVVMHNSLGPARWTAEALPRIVAGLRARGYQLVKVSDLLAADASR